MEITRRRFLCQLTVLGGTSLFPAFPLWADEPPVWVAIGLAASFLKNTQTRVVLPAEQHHEVIYISHTSDDSFLALSAHCTHKGCEVAWDCDAREFVCPCHAGRFDTKGQRTGGPPRKALPSYPTKVDTSGQLLVLA